MKTQNESKLQLETRETCTGSVTIHLMGDKENYIAEMDDTEIAHKIVRAVNSHEALLKASKWLASLADGKVNGDDNDDAGSWEAALFEMQQAIQQAEGN
jgi:hypothetical protein